MKKPSSDLNEIINSLSTAEAKKFIESNNVNQSKKAYMALFKLIYNSKGSIDDQDLQSTLLKKGFSINSFPRIKKYLYDSILQYLSTLQNKHSVLTQIREQIVSLEILIDRNLFSQAVKLLEKLKQTANEHSLEAQFLELLYLESKIFYSSFAWDVKPDGITNLMEDFDLLLNQIEISKQTTEIKIRSKGALVNHMHDNPRSVYGFTNLGFQRRIRALIHSLPDSPLSKLNEANLYYSLGLNAYIEHEWHKIIPNYQKAIDLITAKDSFVQTYPDLYVFLLNNMADTAVINKDESVFHQCIQLLQDFDPKTERAKLVIEEVQFGLAGRVTSSVVLNKENYLLAAEKFHSYILGKTFWVLNTIFIETAFDFAVANFICGDLGKAKQLITYYIQEFKPNKERKIMIAVLELLIAFEKEDLDFIESRIRIISRLIHTSHPLLIICAEISNLLNNKTSQREIFVNLSDSLQEKQSNSLVKIVTHRVHFDSWINSKITNSNLLSETLKKGGSNEFPIVELVN